jgi:protein-disulfide isomerase
MDENVSSQNEDVSGKKSSDIIEIPVGKWVKNIKKNPWIIVSGVLLVIVLVLFFKGGVGVSEDRVAKNVINFINGLNDGEATLVSIEKKDNLYNVVVSYQGQNVPVLVTLDGKYLLQNPVPIVDVKGKDNSGGVEGPTRVDDLDISGKPSKGDENAEIVIVEFSDYQCPFCRKFYSESYSRIVSNYIDSGKVKYVLIDFPLDIHPEAQKASEAAWCVRDQKGDEGYFEMHDILFDNQERLSEENYKEWAEILKVDDDEFASCMTHGKFASEISEGFDYGGSLGVGATPSFFINGRFVEGALPYSEFERIIEEELSR